MFISKYVHFVIIAVFAIKGIVNGADIAPKWQLTTHHHSPTIEEAIKQYFEKRTNVLHVRLHLRWPGSWKYVILHHLTDVLRNSTKLNFRITIGAKYLRSNKYYLYNLWYVDCYEALNDILPYKKKHFSSSPGVYAIVLEPLKGQNAFKDIKKILEKMFLLNIIDVIVITHSTQHQGFSVYSFEVFSKNHCRIVQPTVVNHFIHGRFNDSELFPNKLRNFRNCSIRLLSRNMPPYFSYHKQADGTFAMKGMEAKLLQTIAEHLNFRIDPHEPELYSSGDVHPNGTMTGPYYLLDNKGVDILMGYFFYATHRIDFLEESSSYFTSAIVVIVKHHPQAPSFTWMLDPFQMDTWLAFLAMIAAAILFMYLTHLRYHHGNWLDIIGCIFGEPRTISITSYWARFGIALWYSGFIFINSVYQAKLFDSYNRPELKVPHTLNGLLVNNYTFLVRKHAELRTWLPDLKLPESRIRFINSTVPYIVFDKLLNSTGNVATLTTVARMEHFEHSRQLRNAFDQVPETVQLSESCAYFQHHSYLVKPFNDVILMIRSSGLISRWYSLNLARRYGKLSMHDSSAPKPLDMEKFSIIFFLFACGQALAFVVFFVEMFIGRDKSNSRRLDTKVRSRNITQLRSMQR